MPTDIAIFLGTVFSMLVFGFAYDQLTTRSWLGFGFWAMVSASSAVGLIILIDQLL